MDGRIYIETVVDMFCGPLNGILNIDGNNESISIPPSPSVEFDGFGFIARRASHRQVTAVSIHTGWS